MPCYPKNFLFKKKTATEERERDFSLLERNLPDTCTKTSSKYSKASQIANLFVATQQQANYYYEQEYKKSNKLATRSEEAFTRLLKRSPFTCPFTFNQTAFFRRLPSVDSIQTFPKNVFQDVFFLGLLGAVRRRLRRRESERDRKETG